MKLRDLIKKKNALVADAKALIAAGNTEEAKAKTAEINQLNDTIQAIIDLDEAAEAGNIEGYDDDEVTKKAATPENKTKAAASALRSTIKAMMGKKLIEVEAALVTPSGANGEGYLMPEDVKTRIHELVRSYRSFRPILDGINTTAMAGSFPIENFETVAELVDFTDNGDDIAEANDISFRNVAFSLKQKGAFIVLGNTLLEKTDNDLIEYVASVFAKKAVITENKMAITALKLNKTPKTVAAVADLRKLYNKTLSEAVKFGAVLVTNQDGFDFLDGEEDLNGRPLLQPWPTDPTKKAYKGMPIEVFDNALLPTTGTTPTAKVPFFMGNLKMAASFVDDGKYEFALSEHAAFKKNVTLARVIEHVDVIQVDPSDKVYVYGELTV